MKTAKHHGRRETDRIEKSWADKLKDDRIRRRLTWDKYAKFLGMPMATVQKIVRGITVNPQELTQAQITECLARPVDDIRPYADFRQTAVTA